MSAVLSSTLYAWAWKYAYRVPEGLLRRACNVGSDLAWLRRGRGVRQLELNLARARPDLDRRALRRLSRTGLRSYVRYFREAFVVAHLSEAGIAARVRAVGDAPVRAELAAGKSVVLALGHMGNWDLAGAWASQNLAPVTTVAERLKPEELYQEFLDFRSQLGMTILTFGDANVFRDLQHAARKSGQAIPLLADRDLGRSGVEVDLFGRRARVAAGPAALAISTGAKLYPVTIHCERLEGSRRDISGSRWGIVVTFHDEVLTQDIAGPTRQRVTTVTQRWVDVLAGAIVDHPTDWHMLQKVFVEDLDPVRYANITGQPI